MRSLSKRVVRLEQKLAARLADPSDNWRKQQEWLRSLSDEQIDGLVADLTETSPPDGCSDGRAGSPSIIFGSDGEVTLSMKQEFWRKRLLMGRSRGEAV